MTYPDIAIAPAGIAELGKTPVFGRDDHVRERGCTK